MRFSCDTTGFPLVAVPVAGVEVQLLPVTKVQWERFLAEPTDLGDSWYEEVLTCNPRVSYRRFTVDDRERLFMTGILPEEALAFARWMGEEFTLPSVEQWRVIYLALESEPPPDLQVLLQSCTDSAALVLEKFARQFRARSLLDLSLMRGGVVEWVRQHHDWVGLGTPRPEFHENLWEPLADTVRPIRGRGRLPYFGVRLVRRSK